MTSNSVNWTTKAGWFDDLAIAGQRVVTNPDLVNGVFVATLNTPPLTSCGVGFNSMLLELNYETVVVLIKLSWTLMVMAVLIPRINIMESMR